MKGSLKVVVLAVLIGAVAVAAFAISSANAETADGADQMAGVPIGNPSVSLVTNVDTGETFATIQGAIDDADTVNGHTITVPAGVYFEHLVVNKQLHLLGADKATTTIDGGNVGDHVISVAPGTNGVEISGFTITGTGMGNYGGVALQGAFGCHVHDNNIVFNFVGVAMVASQNNLVDYNLIDTNFFGVYAGDDAMPSSGNTVSFNTISNSIYADLGGGSYSGDGVYLDKNCHMNTVSDNNIVGNQKDGIYAWKSSSHTIMNNVITGNGNSGIELMGSGYNLILGNTIENNLVGVTMRASSWPEGAYPTEDNDFSGNTFSGNGEAFAITLAQNMALHFTTVGDFTYFDSVQTETAPTLSGALPRYWSVTTDMAGFTTDVVFTYLDADITAGGGFPEQSLSVFYDDGGGWTYEGGSGVTVDTVANTVTLTGLTHFTDFTLAPTMSLTVEDATHDEVADNMANAPMLRLAFVNTGAADTLTDVVATGVNTDDANVASTTLWLDDGDGLFEPYGDDAPAIQTNAGMDGSFTGLSVNIPIGTTYLFLSYGVTPGSPDGNTLDMSLAAGAVALTGAGVSDSAEDPAGISTIRQVSGGGLYTPYMIYGYLTNEDGTNSGAGITVTITDVTTGQVLTATSDALGRYEADAADFLGGYADGDSITVGATYGLLTSGNAGTIDTSGLPSLQLNIQFHEPPSSSVIAVWPYNNTGALTVPYTVSDPAPSSGIAEVQLWFNFNGGAYALFATDTLGTGEFLFDDFAQGEGTYGFYTIAVDNYGDAEAAPVEEDALVIYDITLPTVAPAIADKTYVNSVGPGGNPTPITITTSLSDANLLAGSLGIRPYMETPNDVYFITYNATLDPTIVAYEANYYLLDATLVTANINTEVYGSDIIVFGDLNAAHPVGEVVGKTFPAYYALFDEFGAINALYDTQGTFWHTDDTPVALSAADTFYAYHYDGGHGFVVAVIHAGTDTMAIVDTPLPEGRYTAIATAIDKAQNYNWVGEAGGAANFYIDNTAPTSSVNKVAPYVQSVSPLALATTPNDALTPVASVSLYYRYSANNYTWGAWALADTNAVSPFGFSFAFPDGEGFYEFYSAATDSALNIEAAPAVADSRTIYDTADPVVLAAVVDKPAVNNIGSVGTVQPPIAITTDVSDANLLLGSVGIRLEFGGAHETYFVTFNATNNALVNEWYAEYYTIDGVLVTVSFDPAKFGSDVTVFGDLNGAHALGEVIGKDSIPPYYAVFDEFGTIQNIYATQGTPFKTDDVAQGLGGADTFWVYSYDDNDGHFVALSHDDTTTLTLVKASAAEGRYSVVTTAVDMAGKYAWIDEITGGPVVVIDNTKPTVVLSDDHIDAIVSDADTVTITATFSEALSSAPALNIAWTIGGASLAGFPALMTATADPLVWTYIWANPAGDGMCDLTVAAGDIALNPNEAATGKIAYLVDNTAPTSSASIVPIYDATGTWTVTYVFDDGVAPVSGVSYVELWVSYEGGAYALHAVLDLSGTFGYASFLGEGSYAFYTCAVDVAGNAEAAPAMADDTIIYDATKPTSAASIIPDESYIGSWTVSYVASDAGAVATSGLASVELWVSFDGGAYVWFATDNLLTGEFLYDDVTNGLGVYSFYTIAVDLAGNREDAPGAFDDSIIYNDVASVDIGIVQGWNLISIPVAGATFDPGTGAEPLDFAADFAKMASARMVSRWNPLTQKYVSFIVGFHTEGDAQNFALALDQGYFVWFDAAYTLSVTGTVPGARNAAVSPGWNLLGWASPFAGDAGTDWADDVQAGAIDHIAGYNTATDDFSTDVYMFAPDVLVLTPGRGYFVWSDFSAVVSY